MRTACAAASAAALIPDLRLCPCASSSAPVPMRAALQVLLVTSKTRVAPMAQSLSQRFADKGLRFAQYTLKGDAAETAALGALGVRKPPALLALKGTDPSKAVLYEGACRCCCCHRRFSCRCQPRV